MKLFGVTGGVGMGKSTIGQSLQRHGVAVIDTDAIARQLTQPGQPALVEIARTFSPSVFQADGSLDRRALARLVFADAQARAALEAILHPAIRAVWQAEVALWRNENRARGAVIIPLLFETDAAGEFDATICAACSLATQQSRLRERGWTPEEIAGRISAQWPIEQKIAQADFVVWTDTGPAVTETQLERIIDIGGKPQKTPVCA
jgi:dephospho-CoA kinase